MSRAKNWVFTLNNYTPIEEANISNTVEEHDNVVYLIYGREVGENGTPHLQGFVQLARRKSLIQLKVLLGTDRVHLEIARSDAQTNYDYCTKEGDFETFGEIQLGRAASRGNNSANLDFAGVVEAVQRGDTLQEIAIAHSELFIRYSAGVRSLYSLLSQALEPMVLNGPFPWGVDHDFSQQSLFLWGESGIGKTQYALTLFERPLLVTHLDQLRLYDARRFDGIVFDDMSFAHLPRESQIHLLDTAQPRAIHVRYGLATIPRGTRKVFTSNLPFNRAFLSDQATRRRTRVIHLGPTSVLEDNQ